MLKMLLHSMAILAVEVEELLRYEVYEGNGVVDAPLLDYNA